MKNTSHSPNEGAGKMHYNSGNDSSIDQSAGVKDGLSMVEKVDVKLTQKITDNQRPESDMENIGNGMKIGC